MGILDVFKPLIGLPVWNAGQSYGSMGTMQFGKPDLFYTEYYTGDKLTSRKMRAYGQYSFYIYAIIWELNVGDTFLHWSDATGLEINKAYSQIEGQAVSNVTFENEILTLSFDLGAVIKYDFRYESYVKAYGDELIDDLWALDNKVDSFDYSLSKGLEIEMSSWNPDYPA
jgi:hypothetical protein